MRLLLDLTYFHRSRALPSGSGPKFKKIFKNLVICGLLQFRTYLLCSNFHLFFFSRLFPAPPEPPYGPKFEKNRVNVVQHIFDGAEFEYVFIFQIRRLLFSVGSPSMRTKIHKSMQNSIYIYIG